MSAREEILANIRRSLRAGGDDSTRRAQAQARVAAAAPGIVPARGQGDNAARVATFIEQACLANATVERLARIEEAPGAVVRHLRERNLPARLRMGADERLAALGWAGTGLEIAHGPSAGEDVNAISFAEAGVAETGTLVIVSGAHNPSTLNFLPDTHFVLLRAADVEGDLESVWRRLRARHGAGFLPRTVNLITGPSRSADIEQKMLLGAHGPRSLHIIIAED
jgi:L-lactate dehydrogenase complex protein LldG